MATPINTLTFSNLKLKWLFAIVSFGVGALIVIQFRSYAEVTQLLSRDLSSADAFAQIYLLKTANESLNEDILALETQLEQYKNQASGYDTLVAEIKKNELLVGNKPISGPGVILTTDADLSLEWMIDLVNELWAAGAEAVSVNELRLTDTTGGFYKINDLLLVDGKIIEPPYTLKAIGEGEVIEAVLTQPGGLIKRLEADYSKSAVTLSVVERLVISPTTLE